MDSAQIVWKRITSTIAKNDTLQNFCGRNGFAYQTIINQKGHDRYPHVPFLVRVAEIYGCTVDWILFGDDREDVSYEIPFEDELKKMITDRILQSDSYELLNALSVVLEESKNGKKKRKKI